MPLNQLDDLISDLDKSREYVIHCKMGGRSATAVEKMIEKGFLNVVNLSGGIMEWIDRVDPTLDKY